MDKFILDSAVTRQELGTDSMPTNTNMAVDSADSQDKEQLNTSSTSSRPRTTIASSVTAFFHSATNLMQSTADSLLGLRTRSNDASAHEEIDSSTTHNNNLMLASTENVAKSSNKRPQSKRRLNTTSSKKS
jgi:hypothetical protein